MIKDILGILVIVNWNVINHVMLNYENCKCRKSLVDKLVEECNENIDEAKLTGVALFETGFDVHVLTQSVLS